LLVGSKYHPATATSTRNEISGEVVLLQGAPHTHKDTLCDKAQPYIGWTGTDCTHRAARQAAIHQPLT